jgi:AcrR family transcriptional regulator
MRLHEPDAAVAQVLPRGRHAAAREVVWESQRGRMLVAMSEAVAEKGYAQTAVADVIERAGVSRKTFYEHFANKEACFLAAYDAGVDLLEAAIDEAVAAPAGDWIAAATAGMRAYLETLAAHPALARTFLVEGLAAGPVALERRSAVHARFAAQLARIHDLARADIPELPELPGYTFRACVGAIDELVTEELRRRGPSALPALLGPALDVQFGLLIGRELADRLTR